MFKQLKNKLALSKIGNNSNNNQVNQNCNVNNFIVSSNQNDVLNVLSNTGNYDVIQQYTQQLLETVNKTHPLYPAYSATYDSNFKKLISTPETDDALAKYPKKAKGTLELDYKKYPNMSKDETPWEYAYRTQTKVVLKATNYKEYLGEIEDPFPIATYQDGMMIGIEPPPFPPAVSAILKSGNVSIPILLKRIPCSEYKHICFENVDKNSALHITINLNEETGKSNINISRNYNSDIGLQLSREKLIDNLVSNPFEIECNSVLMFHTDIEKSSLDTEFFHIASSIISIIEELLYIEKNLQCKFDNGINNLKPDDFHNIQLISSSIKNLWFGERMDFDNSLHCYYKNLPDDIDKQPTEINEFKSVAYDFSFSLLGVDFAVDKYISIYRKAKINNIKSVLKNIKRKKDSIMITFKPLDGYDYFERLSLFEGITISTTK